MHADVVGAGGVRLDRFRVDVFEELKLAMTVRGLEDGDVGMVSIKPDGGVGPFAADRVTADDGSPRSVKKAMVSSRSRTAMPTFSSFMAMG